MFEELQMDTVCFQINVEVKPDVLEVIANMDDYGDIHLEKGKWKLHRVTEIAEWIEEWRVRDTLYLQENYQSTILQEIGSIKFPFLKKLHVWANNIESIEALATIWIPNLQFLQFCDNNIVSFKSFRKCFFPKLKFLQFCSNKGKQLSPLNELWSPILKQVILQMYEDTPAHSQTLECVFKMQSKKINEIWARSSERVLGVTSTSLVGKKYPKINLYLQKL